MTDYITQYVTQEHDPASIIPIPKTTSSFPDVYQNRISIDVIHDGVYLPPQFLRTATGENLSSSLIQDNFTIERDWGANLVAKRIAEKLSLESFYTVNTARCLLDFGRFPGSSRSGATHLGRFAINHPFSKKLDLRQKIHLLREYYDGISDSLGSYLNGRLIKIAVHTYDQYNQSGTERPEVSLVTRAEGFQNENQLPHGVFDPMFPDRVAEFTVDRVLRDRISLTLEKNKIPVAHNYPYLLPDGSVEVRYQVWSFFAWLQKRFQRLYPERAQDIYYQQVWDMLLDTNLRSSEANEIRSVLHMYRKPPIGQEGRYQHIIQAYMDIQAELNRDNRKLVSEYCTSPTRTMSLGIEVRKDLIWEFDSYGEPIQLRPERGLFIADKIAEAITIYLCNDRDLLTEEQWERWHQ